MKTDEPSITMNTAKAPYRTDRKYSAFHERLRLFKIESFLATRKIVLNREKYAQTITS